MRNYSDLDHVPQVPIFLEPWRPKQPCWLFTVDEDIAYPPDDMGYRRKVHHFAASQEADALVNWFQLNQRR
ncbi:MAG: hypothetical protein WAM11_12910 [Cyanobium sp.]